MPFGLLVLPVDFADARAPEGWDPVARTRAAAVPTVDRRTRSRITSRVASPRTRTLAVTLGPLIHLPGTAQDYSDLGWNGATRTRAMAREALEAARALGVDFARADRDGDGEVDGVLLLHADAGLENDPDARPHRPPAVLPRGAGACSAACARRATRWRRGAAPSASGPTRRRTSSASRTATTSPCRAAARPCPRGGLGAFSLMSAGYWGSGDGHDPALIDAYSASQLGWCDLDAAARRRHAAGAGADPGQRLPRLVRRRDRARSSSCSSGAGRRRRTTAACPTGWVDHPHRRDAARRAGVVEPVAGPPPARAPGGGGRRHLGGARPRPGRRRRRVPRRHRQRQLHAAERSRQRRLRRARAACGSRTSATQTLTVDDRVSYAGDVDPELPAPAPAGLPARPRRRAACRWRGPTRPSPS